MTLEYVLKPINDLNDLQQIFEDFNNSGLMKQNNCRSSDMKATERGLGYDITLTYKGKKVAISLDDFKVLQVSFPLNSSKNLQNELISTFAKFIKEKPIGFYDVNCISNKNKGFRSILFDKLHPENTRDIILSKSIDPQIQLFAQKAEKYKIGRLGLFDKTLSITDEKEFTQ